MRRGRRQRVSDQSLQKEGGQQRAAFFLHLVSGLRLVGAICL